jgi:hypothetical protein
MCRPSNAMGEKQRKIAEVEFRFLIRVTRAIATGNLEGLRQKGLYVDYCNDEIVSTPSAVTQVDAEMWTWAAQRVLNLLEHGEFRQAYTLCLHSLVMEKQTRRSRTS